ncbi:uncharacterized protein [Henckelia pumila]|uniref:uncharacterized protein n=1 Tax=Henckelia pumila TaxID=405737 RepID=UPI003C6E2DC0
MAGYDDDSSHGSVGGCWGIEDDRENHRGHHHHRHDDRRHFSMHRFIQMSPKPLMGGESPEDAENWLECMENCFQKFRCTEEKKMENLSYVVEGRARKWWRSTYAHIITTRGVVTWADFCTTFHKMYFPPALRQAKASEFLGLRQGSMSIDETEVKYNLFLQGLNPKIHDRVSVGDDMTYEALMAGHGDENSHGSIGGRWGSGEVMHFGRKNQGPCKHCGGNHPVNRCRKKYKLPYISLDTVVVVSTSMGQSASAKRLVMGCPLEFEWNVLMRLVKFHPVGNDSWFFYGEGARAQMPLVSALKACRALESSAEGYLIYAVDTFAGSIGLEAIPVVNEFPDVFPEKIPGIPPVREVEFGIDLIPGTSPISRASYRLDPSEMHELKQQLQDLLDKVEQGNGQE